MKYIAVNALLACILMSQAYAGSQLSVTKSDGVEFALGAALPIAGALIKGAVLAIPYSEQLTTNPLGMCREIVQESFLPTRVQNDYTWDAPKKLRNQLHANLFTTLIASGAILTGLFGTEYISTSSSYGLVAGGLITWYGSLRGLVTIYKNSPISK